MSPLVRTKPFSEHVKLGLFQRHESKQVEAKIVFFQLVMSASFTLKTTLLKCLELLINRVQSAPWSNWAETEDLPTNTESISNESEEAFLPRMEKCIPYFSSQTPPLQLHFELKGV